MSTLSTTNIKNPSSVSNNLVLGTDNSTTLDTVKVTTIADSLGANTSTPADIYSGRAKAWVLWDGSGTVSILRAYNCSSITDRGVGTYTVNFTTAFPTVNYSVLITGSSNASRHGFAAGNETTVLRTVSSVPAEFVSHDGGYQDIPYASAAVFY